MKTEQIFLLDTCVWINLVESLESARESRISGVLEELKNYQILTTPVLKDEFLPSVTKHSESWKKKIVSFVKELDMPDQSNFNKFYFDIYPKVIEYLDEHFLKHKQEQEKHYLRNTSRQATLSDGDLSMVIVPFMDEYKDNTFVLLTEDKISLKPSPNPSTKELTSPRRLFTLLKDDIIKKKLETVTFPSEKKENAEDILDIMDKYSS